MKRLLFAVSTVALLVGGVAAPARSAPGDVKVVEGSLVHPRTLTLRPSASAPAATPAATSPTPASTDIANTGSDHQYGFRYSPGEQKLAQSFKPQASAPVTSAEIHLEKNGAPSGSIWVTVEADANGAPSGAPLATSNRLPASRVAHDWVPFTFASPVNLTAGTTYWLVAHSDVPVSSSTHLLWRDQTAGAYADGNIAAYDGSSWTPNPGRDFAFKVHTAGAANTAAGAGEAAVVVVRGTDGRSYYVDTASLSGSSPQLTVKAGDRLTVVGREGKQADTIVAAFVEAGARSAAAPGTEGRPRWIHLNGTVSAVSGSTVTYKEDDGRTLTLDTSRLSKSDIALLQPGQRAEIVVSPGAQPDSFVARFIRGSSEAARGAAVDTKSWERIHGVVQSVRGTTLRLKGDDGNVLNVDMAQVSSSVQSAMAPGIPVTVIGHYKDRATIAAQYIQADTRAGAASPTR